MPLNRNAKRSLVPLVALVWAVHLGAVGAAAGRAPLLEAVKNGDVAGVRALLKQPNSANVYGPLTESDQPQSTIITLDGKISAPPPYWVSTMERTRLISLRTPKIAGGMTTMPIIDMNGA